MATIDSAAPWGDGGGGCRNQRAPRIGDIQRHKALEMDHIQGTNSTSNISGTNISTNTVETGINNSNTIESPTKIMSTSDTATRQKPHLITATSSSDIDPLTTTTTSNSIQNDSDDTKTDDTGQLQSDSQSQESLSIDDNNQNKDDIQKPKTTTTTVCTGSGGGSLPRKFKELQLKTSTKDLIVSSNICHYHSATDADADDDHNDNDYDKSSTAVTSDISSNLCKKKDSNDEGIVKDINNSTSNVSPQNSIITSITPSTSTTICFTNIMISKCLSQSSSTTTITSSSLSSPPTTSSSSMFIDSPSVSMLSGPSPFFPISTIITTTVTTINSVSNKRILPKTQSLDLVDNSGVDGGGGIEMNDDTDADIDEDDDLKTGRKLQQQQQQDGQQKQPQQGHQQQPQQPQQQQHGYIKRDAIPQSSSCSSSPRTNEAITSTAHNKGSQTDPLLSSSSSTSSSGNHPKAMIPKIQSLESRPIYPNVPYSPYGSPYGSPRSNRRRTPLRESRRISIEQTGSFLQLNQYKLMDQIGQGSYGLVKLAYNEEDSTHYAMKILSKRRILRKAGLMGRGPKKTTSPLDRVYREIAVLKKLDHPNVVKLVEVLDDPLEDFLYLVFELVQQGEVLSIPADKPLSEERAWCVFRDALQGLEYLHYQRIIHSDIKPGNLLLAECGRVKIADLGVCNEFLGEDACMNNGSTAGTPAFRAPETLIPGQHLYSGKAADIWALGATLYALVFGNVPFVANSVPAVYEKIKNDQLIIPEKPEITAELRDLIEKILTKDPSRRITLPQIKEHTWVTANGTCPLPSEEENCRLVQISDEDIHTVVKSIPKLDTLILIKTMLKNHSFQNPFSKSVSGRAPQRGGSRLERFTRAGRSNSAPGAYHLSDRQLSSENVLPAVSETVTNSCNESSDQSFEG